MKVERRDWKDRIFCICVFNYYNQFITFINILPKLYIYKIIDIQPNGPVLEEEPVPVHGAGGNVPDKHVSQSGEWTRVSCQGTSLYSQ